MGLLMAVHATEGLSFISQPDLCQHDPVLCSHLEAHLESYL
jgi:hypothetical protein